MSNQPASRRRPRCAFRGRVKQLWCFRVAGLLLLLVWCPGCRVSGVTGVAGAPPMEASTGAAWCWKPPGLVVDEEFAARAAPGAVGRAVPLKRVELPGDGIGLREFLVAAYGAGQVDALADRRYDIAVLHRHGAVTAYYPLALVDRYPLGDRRVSNGDTVGLIVWSLARIDFVRDFADLVPLNAELNVTVAGLVTRPGQIRRYAESESGFPVTTVGDFYQVDSLAGEATRPAGDYLRDRDGQPLANLFVITRLSAELGQLQQIYIPRRDAESFKLEPFPAGNDVANFNRFDVLYNFRLQPGDAIRVTRMNLIPGQLSR